MWTECCIYLQTHIHTHCLFLLTVSRFPTNLYKASVWVFAAAVRKHPDKRNLSGEGVQFRDTV